MCPPMSPSRLPGGCAVTWVYNTSHWSSHTFIHTHTAIPMAHAIVQHLQAPCNTTNNTCSHFGRQPYMPQSTTLMMCQNLILLLSTVQWAKAAAQLPWVASHRPAAVSCASSPVHSCVARSYIPAGVSVLSWRRNGARGSPI